MNKTVIVFLKFKSLHTLVCVKHNLEYTAQQKYYIFNVHSKSCDKQYETFIS